MTAAHQVTLASTSSAEDSSWLAVADVARIASSLGFDYRLIGGNCVSLLVHVLGASRLAPDRATADADLGLPYRVCGDPRLVPALEAESYRKTEGNRFERSDGSRRLVIDLLAPSLVGRMRTNQTHGDMVVDEILGLHSALCTEPTTVLASVVLTDSTDLAIDVRLPDVSAALIMKAFSYAGRLAQHDALDVWRLLEAANAAGRSADQWPEVSEASAGAELLHRHFGGPAAGGPRQATRDRGQQARIRALVAHVVPRSAR